MTFTLVGTHSFFVPLLTIKESSTYDVNIVFQIFNPTSQLSAGVSSFFGHLTTPSPASWAGVKWTLVNIIITQKVMNRFYLLETS